MALLETNPRYRDFLERHGLLDPEQLLALQGVIICGHPRRHVLRATLGSGAATISCLLKREHRVGWRQRWANAWAGFGFVSHSLREARMLAELRCAGVGCSDWLAVGEDDHGRAFLLLQELEGTVDLRSGLRQATPARRRNLARQLGETLAQLHDAGFQHRDLYAKHILVDPDSLRIFFLDWQRARRRRFLSWPQRWHDLAAVHATLADDLAPVRDRLACLRAYHRATLAIRPPRSARRRAIDGIERQARRLLRRRQVREQRQTCLAIGAQRLIWLDGEALCVTPEFHVALGGQAPSWLTVSAAPPVNQVSRMPVRVPGAVRAVLVRRCTVDLLRWLWAWLRGKPFVSEELRQMGLMFRLQRHGVRTPRLLAFGQQYAQPWRVESFLLTAPPADTARLSDWLAKRRRPGAGRPMQHRRLIREAGAMLRRLHDAGCLLGPRPAAHEALLVQQPPGTSPRIVLADLDSVTTLRSATPAAVADDLVALWTSLPEGVCSRTDMLRFFLAYHQARRLDTASKQTAQRWITRRRAVA